MREKSLGVVLATINFHRNLRIGQVSYMVFPWQAFSAQRNETLQFIGPICKL
jgi:hypothetical protein